MISARTKAGLADAKARGIKLGTNNLNKELVQEASAKGVKARKQIANDFAAKVNPVNESLRGQGKSFQSIAAELDKLGVKTARGGKWTATAVINATKRKE
jgi:DNA invertase Pin-like site-specific DNA recombinase